MTDHETEFETTIHEARRGKSEAVQKLFPMVYDELRRVASTYMKRERREHTLSPTAVVNEAYVRLVGQTKLRPDNERHLLAIACLELKRVLIDYARKHHARSARGDKILLSLSAVERESPCHPNEALDVLRTLEQLEKADERAAQVFVLREFGGFTVRQTAEYLKVSERTVKSDWKIAGMFFRKELRKR